MSDQLNPLEEPAVDDVTSAGDDRLEAIAVEIEIATVGTLHLIGKRLHEAREIHSARKGGTGFEAWCKARLNYGRDQAIRLIHVFENLPSDVGNLPTLSRRALMDLAAPSVPKAVRDQVITKAEAGATVTAAEIKRLKDELAKARQKAVDIAAAAVDEVEESFAVERAKLQSQIEEAQRTADLAAEQKYREKADQMAERAVTAKRRELGDLSRNVEGQQRKAVSLKREIAELEAFVNERSAYAHKIKDETAEERHLIEVMDKSKATLVEIAGAFESRVNERYSEHFNGQVRAFLRMMDMARECVAAAGGKILTLDAEDVG